LACFGELFGLFHGGSYIDYLVPGVLTMSVAYGAIGSAVAYTEDRRNGFAARLVTTSSGASPLAWSSAVADAVRAVGVSALLLAVSVPFGFPLALSWKGVATAALVVIASAASFGLLALVVGSLASHPDSVHPPLTAIVLCGLFLSEGFVPSSVLPSWLEPVSALNPFTWIPRALKGALTEGTVYVGAVGAVMGLLVVSVVVALPVLSARSRVVRRAA
jgi:ABC-2 type transport system permease protein